MAKERIENAHDLAKRSGLPIATAYRLVANEGRLDRRLSAQLEALCDVFNVDPCGLLTRDDAPAPRGKPRTKARTKARKG